MSTDAIGNVTSVAINNYDFEDIFKDIALDKLFDNAFKSINVGAVFDLIMSFFDYSNGSGDSEDGSLYHINKLIIDFMFLYAGIAFPGASVPLLIADILVGFLLKAGSNYENGNYLGISPLKKSLNYGVHKYIRVLR